MMNDFMITHGQGFQSHKIAKRMGYFTKIQTGIAYPAADKNATTGTVASNYAQLHERVLCELIQHAQEKGANAIIDLSYDYSIVNHTIICIVASGTGVLVAPNILSPGVRFESDIHVLNYNVEQPYRFTHVLLTQCNAYAEATLFLHSYQTPVPVFMQADVCFHTVFGTEILLENVIVHLRTQGVNTSIAKFNITPHIPHLNSISSARVHVRSVFDGDTMVPVPAVANLEASYQDLGDIKKEFGPDAVLSPFEDGPLWLCCCGMQNQSGAYCAFCGRSKKQGPGLNIDELSAKLGELSSAKDMLAHIDALPATAAAADMLDSVRTILEESVQLERNYGNQKADALKRIAALKA